MCFPVHFAKFLRIAFLQNTSAWLLLVFHENRSKSTIDQTDFTGCMPLLRYRLIDEISGNPETLSTNAFSLYEIAKKAIMI